MQPNIALNEAAKHGDLKAAEDALRRGADPNAVIENWTPLFWAAQEGHTEIVDLLLDAGADVNFSDPDGFTPLKQAIGESHLDTAERLLLSGRRRYPPLPIRRRMHCAPYSRGLRTHRLHSPAPFVRCRPPSLQRRQPNPV